MPEEWRSIVGYEGYYEASSLGRVKRIKGCRGATAGRILAQSMQGPYLAVSLYRNDVKRKIAVHILVAEAFHGLRPAGLVPNHKDLNKLNNHSDNLEWMTQLENIRHANAHGLFGGRPLPGEQNGRAKLTREQVSEIRELRGAIGQREIARRFGVSKTAIQFIHQGKHWKEECPDHLRVREFPRERRS